MSTDYRRVIGLLLITGFASLVGGVGGFFSAFLGCLSVFLPQWYWINLWERKVRMNQKMSRFWAIKFSMTILFMFASIKGLSGIDLLIPILFMGGVSAGILENILSTIFQSQMKEKLK